MGDEFLINATGEVFRKYLLFVLSNAVKIKIEILLKISYMKKLHNLLLICLLAWIISPATAQSWGNYTLYSVQNSTAAYLLNLNNTVYHTWTFSSANRTGYSSYLLPGGTLLRTVKYSPNSFGGGGQTGKLQKVDWNGNILWDFVYSTSTYSMHHDICPMPNGNVLLICYESKTPSQVTQAGCSQNITIWSEKIVEVKQTGPATGTVVWEWHLWDHLVQNLYPNRDNYETTIIDHPDRVNINYKTSKDWIHMNGIDYNPILDQITFSSHNLNEIYVIDHSTTTAEAATASGGNSGKGGRILYRWGNPAAYQATGTTIFNVVHDARWIPEGVPNAGRLVAFNNRGISNTQSAVDQIIPPKVEYLYSRNSGSAYLPSTYTQRHACNGGSQNESGSQSLPNGNMLVTIAMSGLIYEINPAGSTIWTKQVSGTVARAYRYSSHYVNNQAPGIPEITVNGNLLLSSEAATYQWFRNGDIIEGANAQMYQPIQPGIYLVRITDEGGNFYQYSYGINFSPATFYTITAMPNNIKYGHVAGTGTYAHGEIVTLTAFPKSACKFLSWTENAIIISTNPVYFFEVNSNRELIANFEFEVFSIPYEYDLTDLDGTGEVGHVTGNLSSHKRNSLDEITIYPNPARKTITINASPVHKSEIIDLQGNIVSEYSETSTLNLQAVSSGIYVIRIHTKEGVSAKRLIVVK